VGARQQAVVHRVLASEFVATSGCLNRIDIADQVSNCDIGSRQLFDISLVGGDIFDRSCVAFAGNQFLAAPAKWIVGVVADLAACDIRRVFVEQSSQGAKNAALGLSAQAEKNEIMTG